MRGRAGFASGAGRRDRGDLARRNLVLLRRYRVTDLSSDMLLNTPELLAAVAISASAR
jgi:hypothetical protein